MTRFRCANPAGYTAHRTLSRAIAAAQDLHARGVAARVVEYLPDGSMRDHDVPRRAIDRA